MNATSALVRIKDIIDITLYDECDCNWTYCKDKNYFFGLFYKKAFYRDNNGNYHSLDEIKSKYSYYKIKDNKVYRKVCIIITFDDNKRSIYYDNIEDGIKAIKKYEELLGNNFNFKGKFIKLI